MILDSSDYPRFEAMIKHPPDILRDSTANTLLRSLGEGICDEFLTALELVSMLPKQSAYEAGEEIGHVYFPVSGVISIVAVTETQRPVEIATVGNEGMVGLPLFLGARTATGKAYVQVPGNTFRMTAASFMDFVPKCPALTGILHLYTSSLLVQISQGMVCNRVHSVEQRCARWLLMTHDRAQARDFMLTQESLACMLGIRRSGASHAAGLLKARGLIDYSRGTIQIRDRSGLESLCCERYRVVKDEFDRVFGK